MELDKLELTSFTVQNLYRNSLVKLSSTPTIKKDENDSIKFLGGNQQQIILVVNNQHNPFLDDEELSFLTKILTACKLSLVDIAIINLHNTPVSAATLKTSLNAKQVVLFGITSDQIKLPFIVPDFQVQPFDSTIYLTVPTLKTIENDQELKKALWGCFQKMFLNK